MKRMSLVLDEHLPDEVVRLSGERTYSAAVHRAMSAFAPRARAGRILDLVGSGLWQGGLGLTRDDRAGRSDAAPRP
jgi:hypothetical protein